MVKSEIDYLKKMELELINLELKFPTKELNPQINLPFNFLIQKYFFQDSPILEYKLHRVGIASRYSEYLLIVKSSRLKKAVKNGIGIDKSDANRN